MDTQVIITRFASILDSGIEGVEKVLHDAFDAVEQVLGITAESDDAKPEGPDCDPENPAQDAPLGNDDVQVADQVDSTNSTFAPPVEDNVGNAASSADAEFVVATDAIVQSEPVTSAAEPTEVAGDTQGDVH